MAKTFDRAFRYFTCFVLLLMCSFILFKMRQFKMSAQKIPVQIKTVGNTKGKDAAWCLDLADIA